MSFLQKLFEDKLLAESRKPVFEFEIPTYGKFAVLPPHGGFWLQLIYLVLLFSVIQTVVSVVAYKCIVQHRGKVHTYLLGWGVILPTLFGLTYKMIDYLDVQNKAVLTAFTQPFAVAGLRTIEAMYGTSRPVMEHSLTNYMIYYSATIHHIWDEKTNQRVKVTPTEILKSVSRVMYYFFCTSLLVSFLLHHDFEPFPSPVVLDAVNLNLDLFRPNHLANAYLNAVMTYFALICGFEITNMGENFKGYKTEPTFRNPLWESKSPTDFWNNRWNLMVHNVLKRGVFMPARQFFPVRICVLLTFVASGAFHEYIWSVIFYHHKHKERNEDGICIEEGCYNPAFFKLTAFFTWCGILCLAEKYVGKHSVFQWMSKTLPTFLVSALVVLLALPFSHWYTGDWARGHYFSDFAVGVWTIVKIE